MTFQPDRVNFLFQEMFLHSCVAVLLGVARFVSYLAAMLARLARLAANRSARLAGDPSSANPYYSGPTSDHFDGTRFFNPGGEAPRGFADLLRWRFRGQRTPWPTERPTPHAPAKPQPCSQPLTVTMVGHATLLIQVDGLNILTDPVWAERVSPFSFVGPKRVTAPGIAFDDLPVIDLVLVTHNHYDHLCNATLARLVERDNPLIVTPLGNDTLIRRAAPGARVVTGDWGDAIDVTEACRIHLEPCHRWSARGMRDRRMALWAAFVIETGQARIYHVGDTGFHGGANYRTARQKHGGFDLAILPIGAYEPRWFMRAQHQDPDEAVEGFGLCGAQQAIGHHWGTFQLTDEGPQDPVERLHAALARNGISRDRFRALQPGQSWSLAQDARKTPVPTP